MQTAFNPLVNVYQTQLEASRRFADAIFSGTEKIDRVMLEATHRMFNQQLKFAQAMTMARDPQSAASTLQSTMFARSPDETMNYQKEIMRIFAEVQNDIGKSLHEYVEQLGANATTSAAIPLERAQERASEAMYNPMTSMFSVWESAFKEVAALAKRNMAAAQSQAESAVQRTMDTTTRFSTAAAEGAGNASTAAAREIGAAGLAASGAMSTAGGEDPSDRRGASGGSGRRK